MALYAIGDLHLSFGTDKPMDIFGPRWENHFEKLRRGFSALNDDDVCVICGDLTWGMDLASCEEDFLFIDRLPGRKIILKGNHDYWWSTAAKARAFFADRGISTIDILHNNCLFYGDTAICGTRGWMVGENGGSEHDKKITARELLRLEASLKAAGDAEKLCFLHYPPKYGAVECAEVTRLFREYSVKKCCYGHLHGKAQGSAFNGVYEGVEYRLVAADHVDFTPVKILQ